MKFIAHLPQSEQNDIMAVIKDDTLSFDIKIEVIHGVTVDEEVQAKCKKYLKVQVGLFRANYSCLTF